MATTADPPRVYNVGDWKVYKSFYANGPSLFEWVAERPGEYLTFHRRKDAIEHARHHPTINQRKSNPRDNADDAYTAFMSMPQSEWLGLCMSLLGGGVLQPAEQIGFERALADRAAAQG